MSLIVHQPKFVKIVVSDGGIFNVDMRVVELSPTLTDIVDAFCEELGLDHVILMNMKSTTFQKFIQWGEHNFHDQNLGNGFLSNIFHDSDRMLHMFFKGGDSEVEYKSKEEEEPEEECETEEEDEAEEEQDEEEVDELRQSSMYLEKKWVILKSEDEEEESSEDDEAEYIPEGKDVSSEDDEAENIPEGKDVSSEDDEAKNIPGGKDDVSENPGLELRRMVRELRKNGKFQLLEQAYHDEEEEAAEEADEENETEDEEEYEQFLKTQDFDEIKDFEYRDPFNDDEENCEEIETDSDKAWLEFCVSKVDYNRLKGEDKAMIQIIHGLPFDVPLSEWDLQFFLSLSFGEAHALLVAARILKVPDLYLICGTYIGLILKGKTKQQVKKLLSTSRKRPLEEIDFDELDRYFDTLIDTKRQN